MQKENPTSKDTLLKAFKKIDINGDGFITFDELSQLLTMVSFHILSKREPVASLYVSRIEHI